MKRAENITASIFMVLGIFVIKGATSLIYMTDIGPGPGFFPMWLGVLLLSLGMLLIIQNVFSKKKAEIVSAEPTEPLWPGKAGAIRVAIVVFSLLSVAFFIPYIGFRVAIFLLISSLLYTLGKQKILTTLSVAFVGSFGVYFVFTHFLYVELPEASFSWLSALGL